jgi:hypothetical protein
MFTERMERSENNVQGGSTGNNDKSQEKTVRFNPNTKNQYFDHSTDFLGMSSQ